MRTFFKKFIIFILIVSMVSLSAGPILVYPKKTKAMIPTLPADLGMNIWNSITNFGSKMMSKVYQNGNLGEQIIQTAGILWEKGRKIAKWAAGVALNMLLHQILAQLTNQIVNWIQTGEKPKFLSGGLDSFLSDAIDNAGGRFLDQYLGAGWLCSEFSANIKIALQDPETFATEADCKISEMDTFFNSFASEEGGGWDKWIEVTQSDKNIYSAYLLAQQGKRAAEAKARENQKTELEMGSGFLSPKKCTWYDNNGEITTQDPVLGTPPLPDVCKASCEGNDCRGFAAGNGACEVDCQTKTPGSVISHMTNKSLTNYMDKLNNMIGAAAEKAGPYSIYVQPILTALANKLIREGVGLLGVGQQEEPEYGNSGASDDIPNITNTEEASNNKTEAQRINTQLSTLKDNIENEIIPAINKNYNILERISSRKSETLNKLRSIPYWCRYSGWARNKITALENNNYLGQVNNKSFNLENRKTELENKKDQLNALLGQESSYNAPSTISEASTSTDNVITKAENYINVFEEEGGRAQSEELQNAENELNNATSTMANDVKNIIITLTGSSDASNIKELADGIKDAITNPQNSITSFETELIERLPQGGERMYDNFNSYNNFPLPGTLYGKLIKIEDLKEAANQRYNNCDW